MLSSYVPTLRLCITKNVIDRTFCKETIRFLLRLSRKCYDRLYFQVMLQKTLAGKLMNNSPGEAKTRRHISFHMRDKSWHNFWALPIKVIWQTDFKILSYEPLIAKTAAVSYLISTYLIVAVTPGTSREQHFLHIRRLIAGSWRNTFFCVIWLNTLQWWLISAMLPVRSLLTRCSMAW